MTTRSRPFILPVASYLAGVVLLASVPWAQAQQAFFMGLGDLPGGDYSSFARHISADGSTVVGFSVVSGHAEPGGVGGNQKYEAFRWTRATGMVGLGAIGAESNASRISDDGSTIIGHTGGTLGSDDPTMSRGYRWTAATGMTLLPVQMQLPRGINADGSIIVASGGQWSPAHGFQPPPAPLTNLYEVSSDGSVFTGYHINGHSEAWSQQDGVIDLTPITDPNYISNDGKVIIGSGGGGTYRWTKETGVRTLEPLPGGARPIQVHGTSADGSVIVGRAQNAGAFIWDEVHGSRNLKEVLINEYGLGESVAGWHMSHAYAISADGRTIIGGPSFAGAITVFNGQQVVSNTNPQGQQEAWIAFLGDPVAANPADFDGDGDADGADFLAWQRNVGLTSGATRAQGDANADGKVDAGDLAIWRSQFGSASAAAARVPEPTTLVLAGLVAMRRRSRKRVRASVNPWSPSVL